MNSCFQTRWKTQATALWLLLVPLCVARTQLCVARTQPAISQPALPVAAPQSVTSLRAPSVPLVTHDPYFSVWSNSDRLTDDSTRHWTGARHALTGLARIDGRTWRFMGATPRQGAAQNGTAQNQNNGTAVAATNDAPAMTQTSLDITPTRTIYQFAAGGAQLTLTFTSPLLPANLDVLARPVTYITFDVRSLDGAPHQVALYFDASSQLAVNTPDQAVTWGRSRLNGTSATNAAAGLDVLRVGTQDQPILQKSGDNLRIDWGYLLLGVPRTGRTATAIGGNTGAAFAATGALPTTDDVRQPRPAGDDEPRLACTFDLGAVGAATVSRHLLLAYDDLYSLQLMRSRLRPFWRRTGMDASGLLRVAERDYPRLLRRCAAFDAEVIADAQRLGGDAYARLATLAYRQTIAAHKLAADTNGSPVFLSKENFSNGSIGTVDVTYPSAPFFLLFSPTLLKAQLAPVLDYASTPRWKFPFAPHDLGTYPKANGQTYGGGERSEENQMPVEESGNMLIMLGALAQIEGNAQFSQRYFPLLTRWANYLRDKGMDPENQLSTDDFAGHLAHNTNLSIKAIVALGCYARLCDMTGRVAEATRYRNIARDMAVRWAPMADDGDHYRLAFDRPGTWSQKYNLVWDKLLGLNLFPAEVARRELAFYAIRQNAFGLPLDNRRGYTKLDWIVWTATLSPTRAGFESFITPLDRFIQATPDRVPLTDWFETENARKTGFQARSVVGGVFIKFLDDRALWRKWASRAATVRLLGPGQRIVLTMTPIVPSSEQTGQTWRYRTQPPVAGWMGADFDDSNWQQGVGGFGTRGTPGAVVRTEWNTSDIWLRRTITLTPDALTPAARNQLFLWTHHDEDVEIYINGVLAARVAGFTAGYEEMPISAPARAALKPGANVIAIHCRQTGGGQYIDAGLVRIVETRR